MWLIFSINMISPGMPMLPALVSIYACGDRKLSNMKNLGPPAIQIQPKALDQNKLRPSTDNYVF